MNLSSCNISFVLIFSAPSSFAQNVVALPSNLPTTMEERGAPIGATSQSTIDNSI